MSFLFSPRGQAGKTASPLRKAGGAALVNNPTRQFGKNGAGTFSCRTENDSVALLMDHSVYGHEAVGTEDTQKITRVNRTARQERAYQELAKTREFNNTEPKTRHQRKMDSSLGRGAEFEKERIKQRDAGRVRTYLQSQIDGLDHPLDYKNSRYGYASEEFRFQTRRKYEDEQLAQAHEKYVKAEKRVVNLREERQARDEVRWANYDEHCKKEKAKALYAQLHSDKSKGGKGSTHYDIVTLAYEPTVAGLLLKEADRANDYNQALRSLHLQECSNFTGYNPINGSDKHTIEFPSGENIEAGMYDDPIALLKQKIFEKGGRTGVREALNTFRIIATKIAASKGPDAELELNINELKWGLKDFGIELTPKGLRAVFDAIDDDGGGTVDIDEFIAAVRGYLSPERQALVNEAYAALSHRTRMAGGVSLKNCATMFNAKEHEDVRNGEKTPDEVLTQWVSLWDKDSNDLITLEEFQDYYCELGASISDDVYFRTVLEVTWGLAEDRERRRLEADPRASFIVMGVDGVAREVKGTAAAAGVQLKMSIQLKQPEAGQNRKTYKEQLRLRQLIRDEALGMFVHIDEKPNLVEKVVQAVFPVDLACGDYLVRQGDNHNGFCFILEFGAMDIERTDIHTGKDELVSQKRTRGEVMGHFAIIFTRTKSGALARRPNSIKCVSPEGARVWALNKGVFKDIFASYIEEAQRNLQFVSKVDLLHDVLTPDVLMALAETMVVRHYKNMEVAMREGDMGDFMGFVVEGELTVCHRGAGRLKPGNSQAGEIIGKLMRGEHYGENALLQNHRRRYTVVANGNATCAILTRRVFEATVNAAKREALVEAFFRTNIDAKHRQFLAKHDINLVAATAMAATKLEEPILERRRSAANTMMPPGTMQ